MSSNRFPRASRRTILAILMAIGLAIPASYSQGQSTTSPHVRPPLTDAVRGVVTANNQFAMDLFAELRAGRGDGENLLLSPLSISTALTMTYAGARGRTAEQMAEVLHIDGLPHEEVHAGYGELLIDLNAPRAGYDLSVVNRLFGQKNVDFRESFLDRLATDYAAPLESVDFVGDSDASRTHINDWVADNTNQRIKDLLPPGSVTTDTRLVLANAVYLNGKWKRPFEKAATQDAPFYLAGGDASPIPTMFQLSPFRYGEFDGFQMLEMPYAGDDLSMVVLLPNQGDGLAELEASLTAELFDASIAELLPQQVAVHLPKFTLRDKASLGGPLQALGMTDAFNNADFTGIGDGGLAISDVLHQTFIGVNERGTEAAGATAVVIITTGHAIHPPLPPVFRADHPFLFALRDVHTSSLLFLGRMADPVAATAASGSVPEPRALVMALISLGIVAIRGSRVRQGLLRCPAGAHQA